MRQTIRGASWLALLVMLGGLATGCGTVADAPAPARTSLPATEVTPVVAKLLGNGEMITVLITDRKSHGHLKDTNTNQAFSLIGFRRFPTTLSAEYHPAWAPESTVAGGVGALQRAVHAWEAAVSDPALFDLKPQPTEDLPPQRDSRNVIGWRVFKGPGSQAPSALWIWTNGNIIKEMDLFFNLRYDWAVNPPIEAGERRTGDRQSFDLQAVATHEFGHLLGLDHTSDDGDPRNGDEEDATMAMSLSTGELKKQTLTPGDIAGALVALGRAP